MTRVLLAILAMMLSLERCARALLALRAELDCHVPPGFVVTHEGHIIATPPLLQPDTAPRSVYARKLLHHAGVLIALAPMEMSSILFGPRGAPPHRTRQLLLQGYKRAVAIPDPERPINPEWVPGLVNDVVTHEIMTYLSTHDKVRLRHVSRQWAQGMAEVITEVEKTISENVITAIATQLPELRSLKFGNANDDPEMIARGLDAVQHPEKLRSLTIYADGDAENLSIIRGVARFTALTSLDLSFSECGPGPDERRELRDLCLLLPNLTEFCGMTGEFIPYRFASPQNLRQLELEVFDAMDDKGFLANDYFADKAALTSLKLRVSVASRDAPVLFAPLTNLQRLELEDNEYILPYIASTLTQLKELQLVDMTVVRPEQMHVLSHLQNLETLVAQSHWSLRPMEFPAMANLRHMQVDFRGGNADLRQLTRLETLFLGGVHDLQLGLHPHLAQIKIFFSRVPVAGSFDRFLAAANQMPRLADLDIRYTESELQWNPGFMIESRQFSEAALRLLEVPGYLLAQLRKLTLAGFFVSAFFLCRFQNLEHLDLRFCMITETNRIAPSWPAELTALRVLKMDMVWSDLRFQVLPPNLRVLQMFPENGDRAIFASAPHLVAVDLQSTNGNAISAGQFVRDVTLIQAAIPSPPTRETPTFQYRRHL